METVCTDGYTDIEIDGTKYSAYCIETIEQFRKIYSTGEGSETGHYILMDDFDLNEVSGGSTWQPLFKDGLKGIFYGNSKMLTGNLVCASDCALIQSLNGGKVYNLSLLVNISSKEKEVSLGAVAVSTTDAVIKNVTSDGNVIGSGGTVGGLVMELSQSQIINSVVQGRVEGGSVGGLVGIMSGGRITTSYFYGELTAQKNGGGLVYFMGGLKSDSSIEGCAVFGNLNGLDENHNVSGMIGSIGDWSPKYTISIVSSMSAADISNASTGAMVASLTVGILNVNDVYTLGDFSDDVKYKWNDVHVLTSTGVRPGEPKFYASWFTKGERSFKPVAITAKDIDLYIDEKLLIDVLAEISPNWATYLCTIETGPAAGSAKTYVLPLPKGMPVPKFCRKVI
jgi:hypothetical protein